MYVCMYRYRYIYIHTSDALFSVLQLSLGVMEELALSEDNLVTLLGRTHSR